MAIHQLTESEIARKIADFAADLAKKDTLIGDGGGLFIRLRRNAAGAVSAVWTFIYRPRGAKANQRMVLGNYADHATGRARAWAAEQRRSLDEDRDPADARRKTRLVAAETWDKTLGALLVAYVEHLRNVGKSSADDAENLFKNHVSSALRRRLAASIDYGEFVAMLNAMADKKGRPILRTQAKVRAYLRAAYCLSTRADQQPGLSGALKGFGIVPLNNPMLSVVANPNGIAGRGMRVLTADELRTYIAHVEKLGNHEHRRLLLLQVFTGGQRMAQLIAARIVGDQLHIEDRKGKRNEPRQHYVPLLGRSAELAVGHVPITDLKANKALQLLLSGAVRRISKRMGMAPNPDSPHGEGTPFSLDDIRRTIETLLSAAGFSKDIRAQLLSHGISGVQDAHYDMHHYRPEKTAALLTLHRIIEMRPAA